MISAAQHDSEIVTDTNKLVSVVIPTFNNSTFLRTAIQSVLTQTYSTIEAIVVDDASTDDTLQVLNEITDPRLLVIHHDQNLGAGAARNTGLEASEGEYIAFLDADDYWVPDKLSRQVRLLDSCSNSIGLIYSDYEDLFVDGRRERYGFNGMNLPDGRVFNEILDHLFVRTSTVLMRREVMEHIGLFDTTLRSGQDYHFIGRAAYYFGFQRIDDVLVIRRIHERNLHRDIARASVHQIEALHRLAESLGLSQSAVKRPLSYWHQVYGFHLMRTENYPEARKHLYKAFTLLPSRRRAIIYWCLTLVTAWPYRILRTTKRLIVRRPLLQ